MAGLIIREAVILLKELAKIRVEGMEGAVDHYKDAIYNPALGTDLVALALADLNYLLLHLALHLGHLGCSLRLDHECMNLD